MKKFLSAFTAAFLSATMLISSQASAVATNTYSESVSASSVSATALSSDIYNVSKTLSNPNASDSAKRLMSFLCDSYGKKTITGQFADDVSSNGGMNGKEFSKIKTTTGKTPAILGLDLMRYTPSRVANGDSTCTIEYAEEFAQKGGIVTLCWHWNAPSEYLRSGNDSNGNPRWWSGFYTSNVDTSKFKLDDIMNGKNQSAYNTLMSDIDAIAVQLKKLKDKNIPVLFRPLHEAAGSYQYNNPWFWWGSGGADAYKKLWNKLYDKLTNEYKLDNLIWVWNGQNNSWYPGDNTVDIVGYDVYAGNHQYASQSSYFKYCSSAFSSNKLIAMSENGCLFNLDSAKNDNSLWSYFSTWSGDFATSTNYTESDMWKKVYQNDLALTLENLPDLKNYPLDSSSATISFSSTSKSIGYGDTATLTPTTSVVSPTISWSSSNSSVASISAGKVTANKLGTAVITATLSNGKSASCTITVTKKNLSSATVSLSTSVYTYSGTAKKPAVTVKVNGKALTKATDFTYAYSSNTSAGTAKVTITGKGNYTGTVTKSFKINKRSVSKAVISSISAKTYTGKSIKPSVTVKYGSTKLVKDKDYAVKYSTNTNIGKGKVTITGKGNYSGTVSVFFKINPKRMSLKASAAKKAITASWSKQANTSGYLLQYSTNSAFKNAKTVKLSQKVSKKTLSKLSAKKYYYLRIRSYKTVSGTTYYGSFSTAKKVKTK